MIVELLRNDFFPRFVEVSPVQFRQEDGGITSSSRACVRGTVQIAIDSENGVVESLARESIAIASIMVAIVCPFVVQESSTR